jgi:membrane-bound lytic murein transglycosylase B
MRSLTMFRFPFSLRNAPAWFFGLCLSANTLSANAENYATYPEVKSFIKEMVRKHKFSEPALTAVFAEVQKQQSILDAMNRPVERVMEWRDYRKIFMTEQRIGGGKKFLQDNQATLAKAEARWGVPPEIVTAILGVETRYGEVRGNYRLVESLSTLAFDYPRRGAFFKGELEQLLLLSREQGFEPLAMKGSYAGAMGYGQFMPSSYRHFALDFDGDGRADLLDNVEDAIGSIAHYFAKHGWQKGEGVAWQVYPKKTPTSAQLPGKQKPVQTVAELASLGLDTRGLGGKTRVRLIAEEGEAGREYWLARHNFYVITRYNHSDMYALAVHELSEAIRKP